MKPVLALLAVLPMVGCFTPPTTVATPRAATSVNASFDRTWNAVIDVFAEQNIPIATMEKASGFIVADAQFVGADARQAAKWADCGTTYGGANPATAAKYNVLVRSVDDHTSTVKVTASGLVPAPTSASLEVCGSRTSKRALRVERRHRQASR